LIQLPPKYDYNPENLESFFELLDPLFRYVVEFRNLSWMREETWSLLEKYKVAYSANAFFVSKIRVFLANI
jgi:uncharacterized protein YecE (DUF72 family)